MMDFGDTRIAFEGRTDSDLRRAKILFRGMASSSLIQVGKWATQVASFLHLPLGWALKPTIYKQFVAGESLPDTIPALDALMRRRVLSVLDYSAEGGQEPQDIRCTYQETMRSIDFAANNPRICFAVFKPSGLIRTELLERVSAKKCSLDETQGNEYGDYRERFMALCARAAEVGIPILVDAERYCWQQAIDDLTEEAMHRFNGDIPIVFTTLQMYRHDRMDYLRRLDDKAQREGFIPGIKFVRGAYMESERSRAATQGYPDPICANKAMTDENYDTGLRYVMERIDRFGLFAGTHNEASNKLLMQLIDDAGIARDDTRATFSQLYGMSDNITFNLSNAGYRASKYVPYGPVDKVLPYLIRRAEENTSIAGQTSRELSLINKEIKRRKKA